MNCEKLISQNIDVNCDSPMIKGLEGNAVLINRADIKFDTVVFNTTRKNVIESLPLMAGKKGYSCYVPGATPFSGLATSLKTGTYINTWDNNAPIVILDNGPDVCDKVIDGLANGQFVLIVENKHKGSGDAAFQVYGFYQGLRATAGENDKYSEDLNGGWSVTLTETGAPKSGLFLYSTSYTATKALFDGLTSPAV